VHFHSLSKNFEEHFELGGASLIDLELFIKRYLEKAEWCWGNSKDGSDCIPDICCAKLAGETSAKLSTRPPSVGLVNSVCCLRGLVGRISLWAVLLVDSSCLHFSASHFM
jgi:hypothetical protein